MAAVWARFVPKPFLRVTPRVAGFLPYVDGLAAIFFPSAPVVGSNEYAPLKLETLFWALFCMAVRLPIDTLCFSLHGSVFKPKASLGNWSSFQCIC